MLQDGAPQLQVWFTNPINYSYIYHSKWVILKKVYIIIYGGFEPPKSFLCPPTLARRRTAADAWSLQDGRNSL